MVLLIVFEENIRRTKEVVDRFKPLGYTIEAELGHVGNETDYEKSPGELQLYRSVNCGGVCLQEPESTRWPLQLGTNTVRILRLPRSTSIFLRKCGTT